MIGGHNVKESEREKVPVTELNSSGGNNDRRKADIRYDHNDRTQSTDVSGNLAQN